MVSPEELFDALNLMEGLGLGMKVRQFEESGVRVLQECGFDDANSGGVFGNGGREGNGWRGDDR